MKTAHSLQTPKWLYAAVQPEESSVSEGRLLLEEKEGWKDHEGRPHEIESPERGVHIRLLCPFCCPAYLPSEVLLALTGNFFFKLGT